jgi:large subunit ribosomal protein L21
MYAVIETGGKQYRVAPGDKIQVESLPGERGAQVELGKVVALVQDSGTLLSGGDVANVKVTGTITAQGRGDKVLVFKFKRKKQYKRTIGHRQNYTEVQIGDIVA